MKTTMISTGNKVAGTTNNSEICCPLILEMATFQLEVRKKKQMWFFFPFKFTDPLTFRHGSLQIPGPQMKIMEWDDEKWHVLRRACKWILVVSVFSAMEITWITSVALNKVLELFSATAFIYELLILKNTWKAYSPVITPLKNKYKARSKNHPLL